MGALLSTHTYKFIDADLMGDISAVISEIGTWFTSNPLLAMVLTVGIIGLGIKLVRSLRGAIM